ncbi:MAG: SGNH/GDSL hydrolase family protein [Myxococcota bacterium]
MTRPESHNTGNHRRFWRRLAQGVAISLAWGVALVAVPELLLRTLADPPSAPEPIVGNRRFVEWLTEQSVAGANAGSLYRSDRRLIWSLEPGAQIVTTSQHYDHNVGERQAITITINRDGHRGPQISQSAAPDALRILCMGDSNFFGYPLSDDYAFPRVLERQLQASGADTAEVINAATPGYTVVQGWRWYESKFRDYPYDVLMLSYLNNDAWPQQRADTDTLEAYSAPWRPMTMRFERLWTVRWVRERRTAPAKDALVARVDLETFEDHYRRFIAAARARNARVMLVDHRAYEKYSPYSQVLRRLATEPDVSWLPVGPVLSAGFSATDAEARHPELAARVRRRWGTDKLQRRPYLWYYAEFFPEHLNELGNVFVAELLRDEILGRH